MSISGRLPLMEELDAAVATRTQQVLDQLGYTNIDEFKRAVDDSQEKLQLTTKIPKPVLLKRQKSFDLQKALLSEILAINAEPESKQAEQEKRSKLAELEEEVKKEQSAAQILLEESGWIEVGLDEWEKYIAELRQEHQALSEKRQKVKQKVFEAETFPFEQYASHLETVKKVQQEIAELGGFTSSSPVSVELPPLPVCLIVQYFHCLSFVSSAFFYECLIAEFAR